MRLLRLRGRCIAAGPDRPHGLVGDDELDQPLGGDAVETVADLAIEHRECLAAFALIQRLADADDWRQPRGEGRTDLAIHRCVGFTKQRAALGVADDHVLRPRFRDHRRAHFAGEGSLALPVQILRGDGDGAVACRVRRCMQGGERRRHDDVDAGGGFHEATELLDVIDRLGDGLEHLPIAGDEWGSHLGVLGVWVATCQATLRRREACGRRETRATRRRRSRCA